MILIAMEMASNEAIKQAVMANMGVSSVSRDIIAHEWTHRLLAAPAVEGLPMHRGWHIVHAVIVDEGGVFVGHVRSAAVSHLVRPASIRVDCNARQARIVRAVDCVSQSSFRLVRN